MTFRFFLDVPKECREAGSLSETGVNHSCKINYPHKIAASAGLKTIMIKITIKSMNPKTNKHALVAFPYLRGV